MPIDPGTAALGAAAIGAGASLFGGKKDRDSQKKLLKLQMDESIQRRVRDAQKAGIHPLFALGASVGASPSTSMGGEGIRAAGEAIGSGLRGYARAKADQAAQARADQVTDAQLREIESRIRLNDTEAAFMDSQRARIGQKLTTTGRDGVTPDDIKLYALGSQQDSPEAVEYVKPEVPLHQEGKPHLQAGAPPGWRKETVGKGKHIYVLASDWADELNILIAAPQLYWHYVNSAVELGGGLFKMVLPSGKTVRFRKTDPNRHGGRNRGVIQRR